MLNAALRFSMFYSSFNFALNHSLYKEHNTNYYISKFVKPTIVFLRSLQDAQNVLVNDVNNKQKLNCLK